MRPFLRPFARISQLAAAWRLDDGLWSADARSRYT